MRYQHFRELEDFSPPDLVLVQNCGFDEFKEGWEGLGSLLQHNGAPVIFTSIRKSIALRDLKRFQEFCGQEVEVLVQCQENKRRSYRPRRSVQIDVYYINSYISIVRAK